VSPNLRVRLGVGLIALVGAGAVAGVVLATRQDPAQPQLQCRRAAAVVVPGVAGRTSAVRAAFASWPHGTVERLQVLANRYPHDAVVQLNYGLALECRGYFADAEQQLERAKRVGRDTQYEIDADQLLHPSFFQGGYPVYEPSTTDPLLVRGSLLQRQGHQHSAERLYLKAARQQPTSGPWRSDTRRARSSATTWACSWSGSVSATRRWPSSSRRSPSGPTHGSANRSRSCLHVSNGVGPGSNKDEPKGLCVRPASMRQFRIR